MLIYHQCLLSTSLGPLAHIHNHIHRKKEQPGLVQKHGYQHFAWRDAGGLVLWDVIYSAFVPEFQQQTASAVNPEHEKLALHPAEFLLQYQVIFGDHLLLKH